METSYIEHRQIKAHISTFFPPRRTKFLQFWIKSMKTNMKKIPFYVQFLFFLRYLRIPPLPPGGFLKINTPLNLVNKIRIFGIGCWGRDRVLGSG